MTLNAYQLYFIILPLVFAFCSKEKVTDGIMKEDHSIHASIEQSMVHLTKHDQLVANIKTDTVIETDINEQVTLLGFTSLDDRNIAVISARLRGRLDNLSARNPGQEIHIGQLLYSIYSEELLSDERSFLLALDQHSEATSSQKMTDDLVKASRKKLRLWGLTDKQIADLEKSKQVSPVMKVYSPVNGSMLDLLVSEGQYVEAGTPLFRVVNLNSIWVETQVYSGEISYLKQNPQVSIGFEAYPNQVFAGTLIFSNPVLEQDQKINLVRFAINNRERKIKPGMMAYVQMKYNRRKSLVIPRSAVILEAGGATVWIESASGMYEKRMIITGNVDKTYTEVLFGLEKGQKVVSSGAYLINSQFILMNGANTMGGMKM